MSSIEVIKAIREKTSLSLKDIKKAVTAMPDASEDEIIDHLRKQGVLKQQSRQDRVTSQGSVFSYVHEGRIGVLVEIKCETDFVSRSDVFQEFGKDVALHIAAYKPPFLSEEEVTSDFIDKELEIAKSQLEQEGKPAEIIGKILEGKKNKIFEESTLLNQDFLKDSSKKVKDVVAEVGQTTGEKIEITRFTTMTLN
jgi:elongation factor Ts